MTLSTAIWNPGFMKTICACHVGLSFYQVFLGIRRLPVPEMRNRYKNAIIVKSKVNCKIKRKQKPQRFIPNHSLMYSTTTHWHFVVCYAGASQLWVLRYNLWCSKIYSCFSPNSLLNEYLLGWVWMCVFWKSRFGNPCNGHALGLDGVFHLVIEISNSWSWLWNAWKTSSDKNSWTPLQFYWTRSF